MFNYTCHVISTEYLFSYDAGTMQPALLLDFVVIYFHHFRLFILKKSITMDYVRPKRTNIFVYLLQNDRHPFILNVLILTEVTSYKRILL